MIGDCGRPIERMALRKLFDAMADLTRQGEVSWRALHEMGAGIAARTKPDKTMPLKTHLRQPSKHGAALRHVRSNSVLHRSVNRERL